MADEAKTYRLITRSDFDGLVCAVLLKEMGMVNEIKFVHPKDMQDGKVEVGPGDVTANLPYVNGVHLAFDHHSSEDMRVTESKNNFVNNAEAPSAARVIYDHFGGKPMFSRIPDDLMQAADKADAARFTVDEVMNPAGWVLLSFLTDSRTGLGRFRDFRVSNYDLMMNLIDLMRSNNIEQIMAHPDVKERVDLYKEHAEKAREQLRRCATQYDNVVVLDLRNEETIYATNRFMLYGLFHECNISAHVMWGKDQSLTVFAVGKSIFKRDSKTNVGKLMLQYGGGGHVAAGTCQVANDKADSVLQELIDYMRES